ncbi:RidA family protein [Nisaea sediminum]|uniref:RidA family protein n=1 Tax=Nisaea sediminum TaxID=2775867 RepID=UPI001866501B|nr:RidA family protein [Nisaea sediminum]
MTVPVFHLMDRAPAPVAPYSHAVEIDGWCLITGQLATDPEDDARPLPEGIEAQTRRTMENLRIVLEGLGLDFSHVVTARVFLTEFERDYEAMNAVYAEYFGAETRPARTCIGVTGIARKALVEIDCIAYRTPKK